MLKALGHAMILIEAVPAKQTILTENDQNFVKLAFLATLKDQTVLSPYNKLKRHEQFYITDL